MQCENGTRKVPKIPEKNCGWGNLALVGKLRAKPRTRISPMAKSGCARYPECLCRFVDVQPGKDTEFHQLGHVGCLHRQPVKSVVDLQKAVRLGESRKIRRLQGEPLPVTARFVRLLPPNVLNEYPSHRLGSRSEEVPSTEQVLPVGRRQPELSRRRVKEERDGEVCRGGTGGLEVKERERR